MALVFNDLQARERDRRGGVVHVAPLWMKEAGGMVRFALRERLSRVRIAMRHSRFNGPGFSTELRWAWRGVRARGWRAALVVLLVGLALAGNVLVFAVADSVVFTRVPYPRAHEIIEVQSVRQDRPGGGDRFMSAALLDEWRKQTDLFVSVQAYLTKNTFVVADGRSEIVPVADITPGLVELLGIRPKWGRSFVEADAHQAATLTFGPDGRAQVPPIPALISESLARERFGAAEAAVGRTLETTAYPLAIVGVMPHGFAFPQGSYRIWRALDPRGPLARDFAGVQSIARTVPEITPDVLRTIMTDRSQAIGQAAGTRAGYLAAPGEFYVVLRGTADRTMFLILIGGALCLLLTACANVASLELAGAIRRARTFAVRMALGASRRGLARVALLEGGLLMAAAGLAALGLAWLGLELLAAYLPPRLASTTANPIDLDLRALLYMSAIGAATWLLASLPIVIYASRSRLLGLLKAEERTAAASRGGMLVRRCLTVAEVAIAVVLVVGGVMYTRSYIAMLGADKGFDSTNLVEASYEIPVEYYATAAEFREFANAVLSRVRAVPGVLVAMDAAAPPSGNSPFGGVRMEIDGRAFGDETFTIGETPVPSQYFVVIGLPLRGGRGFDEGGPATDVIVTERFARRFWPDGNAVGHTFRRLVKGREGLPNQVIGVVADFRTGRPDRSAAESETSLYYYTQRQPPPTPKPPPPGTPPRPPSTGGSWRFFDITARLDSPARAAVVLDAARSVDRRLRVTLESVDEKYASMFADVLLATRVTGAFAGVAYLVAVVGVYGVDGVSSSPAARARSASAWRSAPIAAPSEPSFSVIAAARPDGRTARPRRRLGGWRARSNRHCSVFRPRIPPPTRCRDEMLATAMLATWHPARQAARVDPAITLRSE